MVRLVRLVGAFEVAVNRLFLPISDWFGGYAGCNGDSVCAAACPALVTHVALLSALHFIGLLASARLIHLLRRPLTARPQGIGSQVSFLRVRYADDGSRFFANPLWVGPHRFPAGVCLIRNRSVFPALSAGQHVRGSHPDVFECWLINLLDAFLHVGQERNTRIGMMQQNLRLNTNLGRQAAAAPTTLQKIPISLDHRCHLRLLDVVIQLLQVDAFQCCIALATFFDIFQHSLSGFLVLGQEGLEPFRAPTFEREPGGRPDRPLIIDASAAGALRPVGVTLLEILKLL